jgi:glycosyltransferase involved in cell wall biosynthesis
MPHLTYALVTPAKNEAEFIEQTILSVVAQDYKPIKWVIVDDGSSDGTADIVARFAQHHDFIVLLRRNGSDNRNFASKVQAFNSGLSALEDTHCELIGNLDADIVLRPDYYANIISAFEADPNLGISGGTIHIVADAQYFKRDSTDDSVAGAIQLFRKGCFQQIGGYVPLEGGGIDAAAEITARKCGWSVRKVPDNPAYEQRRTGYHHGMTWRAAYKEGVQYHKLGYGTLFYCLRSANRLGDHPLVVGSMCGLVGFVHAKLRGDQISLSPDIVSYLRTEQLRKIRQAFVGWWKKARQERVL